MLIDFTHFIHQIVFQIQMQSSSSFPVSVATTTLTTTFPLISSFSTVTTFFSLLFVSNPCTGPLWLPDWPRLSHHFNLIKSLCKCIHFQKPNTKVIITFTETSTLSSLSLSLHMQQPTFNLLLRHCNTIKLHYQPSFFHLFHTSFFSSSFSSSSSSFRTVFLGLPPCSQGFPAVSIDTLLG
jgi:hypothetical protein